MSPAKQSAADRILAPASAPVDPRVDDGSLIQFTRPAGTSTTIFLRLRVDYGVLANNVAVSRDGPERGVYAASTRKGRITLMRAEARAPKLATVFTKTP